jgi:SNF2 family DNA or RNA helicase
MKSGQGALLGDDMGLGKTLQSIALIRWVLQQNPDSKEKVLVVCPKSLIPNWVAEFERFAPELRVLAVQGSKRHESLKSIDGYDVLITSYPLISRDLTHYQTLKFELGIFDEASFLRNPDTETAAAARSLNLRTRLALSGTPVENGVRDLWSIFQILLPGYLGNRQSFSERFEKPLQTPGDAAIATANRLRRLIRPFFLRRTKSEVLKELPEKIEQVFWCEMSSAQGEIYRRLLEEGREEIRNARRRSGQNGARMTMLTVLLRLRQVCCDVRLAGLPQEKIAHLDLSERSGKWGALDERLDEALADGGKVLVFSQFVAYLKTLREHLDRRQIGYAYLDGSTQDRGAEVKSFQTDPQKRVFLISLKAGGYGLNLTQADQVFLMDPWWNPAVEAQAIDRAHRFGQGRVVNAYRFVMRGTVEERVLALQEKKRGLISATIEERAPMMEGLSDSDLESLLEG